MTVERSSISRFEQLIAWQNGRELNKQVYLSTSAGAFARDFGLARQIQRAAVSMPSNIAEGFERKNPAEFHQFLAIAKGSCAELRTQLYLALDVGYLDQLQFDSLMRGAEEVGRIVGALRVSVARMRDDDRRKK